MFNKFALYITQLRHSNLLNSGSMVNGFENEDQWERFSMFC